jgi:2-isopropylmalate synthase
VECAINGLGERAGNAALEEVVMALRTRSDYFGNVETTLHTEELARTSRMVARLTGYPVQYNKAIIGRNAFAHEAGIHQHGVLEDRETYEIIDASTVGQEAAQIVLGKHSGRHAFADSLAKMGITVQGDALNQAFVRFKELADRKVEITEADLEAIVAEELGITAVHRYTIVSLDLRGGTSGPARASVVLSDGDGKVEADGTGNGMVDAAIEAISKATGISGTVLDFKVSSVTSGGDALGAVVISLDADGVKASGRGVSTDVVEASARAYLAAVNKVVRMRERPETRERAVGP